MIQTVFFDLDGTLTDPFLGITNSVIHALKHFGIHVDDANLLRPFIGPPLLESFERYYGFSPEQSRVALAVYREYFAEKGLFENRVFDGCKSFLQLMRDKGKRLVVASSKPEVYVKKILEHFSMDSYFSFIGGSDLAETRVKKEDILSYCMEALKEVSPTKCVMVGDRKHDIQGAKAHGMRSIGVLYGFGSQEELEAAGADFLASDFRELEKIILNN